MPEPPPIETIIYQPYLLAYVDVLGFRERINATLKDPYEIQQTYALLHSMKEYSAGQQFYATVTRCISHFQAFSDLIIRATEMIDKSLLTDVMNFECTVLAYAQCREIFSSGILLRGAMCFGDLFVGDHATFGPALIDAHDIESQVAVFPRIVIDHELLRAAQATATISVPVLEDFITRGDDGVYFVDYLFGQCMHRWAFPDEESMGVVDMLESHQDFIQELLRTLTKRADYRKRQKAIWLANYHNGAVKRLEERLCDVPLQTQFKQAMIPESLYQF